MNKLEFKRSHLLLLVLLTALTYGNTLFNGFVGDDNVIITSNSFYDSWENFPRLFKKGYNVVGPDYLYDTGNPDKGTGSVAYRPGVSFTFFLDSWLWGKSPFGFHLQNLIVHILNIMLVYLLVCRIRLPLLAFGAALIFSIHPVQAETVSNIGFRSDLWSALYMLISAHLWIYAKKSDSTKLWGVGLSGIFYLFAMLTKEPALALIILLPAYDIFFSSKQYKLKEHVVSYAYFSVLCAIYLYLYLYQFPNTTSGVSLSKYGAGLYAYMDTIVATFLYYWSSLLTVFFVKPLPLFYKPQILDNALFYLFSGTLVLVLLRPLLRVVYETRQALFFGLWGIVFYLPISNIFPLVSPIAYRYLYIPMIGYSVLLFLLLNKIFERIPKSLGSVQTYKAILLVPVIVFTVILNMAWKSDYTLNQRVVTGYPDDFLSYEPLAFFYHKNGQQDLFMEHAVKAIEQGSDHPMLHCLLGAKFMTDGKPEEAFKHFEAAKKRHPNYWGCFVGLGWYYENKGDLRLAEDNYKKAVSLAPNNLNAYYDLLYFYRAHNRPEDAMRLAQEIRALGFPKSEAL